MKIPLRHLFTVVLFGSFIIMTLRPVADPDFWWHLSAGQFIFDTKTIPQNDPFSFTNFGEAWTAHEWLSELILYSLYRVGGLTLLIGFFSLLITAAFGFAYLRSAGKPYFAGFALFLGAIATAPVWGVRPQMFTFLLASLFLYLLDLFEKKQNWMYLVPLPLITVLWVNLHAGYAMGLFIMLIYIITLGIHVIRARVKVYQPAGHPGPVAITQLLLVFLICIMAVMVNPNGIQMYVYPFETLTSPSMQQFIQEWFSPDFHLLEWQPMAWLFLALMLIGFFKFRPSSSTHAILTLIFAYASLRSMRHITFLTLAAVPMLSNGLENISNSWRKINPIAMMPRWVFSLSVTLIITLCCVRLWQVTLDQKHSDASNFPVEATEWISNNQPDGNLYNTYGWGGYLIWKLYPDYQIYIDGRADLYGDQFIYDYLEIYNALPGWEQQLDRGNIRIALIEPGSVLASALKQSPLWRVVVEDESSILFIR